MERRWVAKGRQAEVVVVEEEEEGVGKIVSILRRRVSTEVMMSRIPSGMENMGRIRRCGR